MIKGNQQKNNRQKVWHGTVVSDKMDKTIVVRVSRVKVHPQYHKRISISKKYSIHDPKNKYKVGDTVSFVESRPLSKRKRWTVI